MVLAVQDSRYVHRTCEREAVQVPMERELQARLINRSRTRPRIEARWGSAAAHRAAGIRPPLTSCLAGHGGRADEQVPGGAAGGLGGVGRRRGRWAVDGGRWAVGGGRADGLVHGDVESRIVE